jgi:hypothetical protein
MRNRRYYADGGNMIPINNNMQYVDGASHEQGGVPLQSGDEVEGGEVIQQAGSPTNPSERVFSNSLRIDNDESNPTFAEAAEMIGQQKAQLEQVLLDIQAKRQGVTEYASKRSIPERNTIERDIDKLGKQELEIMQQLQQLEEATNQLFQLQEEQATQMGYRDENGMPNEYVGDSGSEGSEGMQPEQGFRYGGLGRRSYATGGYGETTNNYNETTGSSLSNGAFQANAGSTGNWEAAGSALKGVAAGAASGLALGATFGSIAPGIGTVIGGAVGLIGGTISGLVNRKKARRAEEERQVLERNQMNQYLTSRRQQDAQSFSGFSDNQDSIGNIDYYARRGGILSKDRRKANTGLIDYENLMFRRLNQMSEKPVQPVETQMPQLVIPTKEINIPKGYAERANIDRELDKRIGKTINFAEKTGTNIENKGRTAPALSNAQITSLGASALSAIGQTFSNIDAYKRMEKFRPTAPMYNKLKRYNTQISTQDVENKIRGSYAKAKQSMLNNTSNAQIRRAYVSNMAAKEADSLSSLNTQKANQVRQLQNRNVDVANRESEMNTNAYNQYVDRVNQFNIGLTNMRTGIADQSFSNVNNIIGRADQMGMENKKMDVLLSDASDEVKNKLYDSWYGSKKRRGGRISRKRLMYS